MFRYLLEASSFLMRDRKGVDPDGRGGVEEPEGGEGRETALQLHCMRKESMFNKGGKKEKWVGNVHFKNQL